jgi:predicted RNA-binding Zn-ribbon protein involved in translation (DUF1610 family)
MSNQDNQGKFSVVELRNQSEIVKCPYCGKETSLGKLKIYDVIECNDYIEDAISDELSDEDFESYKYCASTKCPECSQEITIKSSDGNDLLCQMLSDE